MYLLNKSGQIPWNSNFLDSCFRGNDTQGGNDTRGRNDIKMEFDFFTGGAKKCTSKESIFHLLKYYKKLLDSDS